MIRVNFIAIAITFPGGKNWRRYFRTARPNKTVKRQTVGRSCASLGVKHAPVAAVIFLFLKGHHHHHHHHHHHPVLQCPSLAGSQSSAPFAAPPVSLIKVREGKVFKIT
jgi:hypothetical protein